MALAEIMTDMATDLAAPSAQVHASAAAECFAAAARIHACVSPGRPRCRRRQPGRGGGRDDSGRSAGDDAAAPAPGEDPVAADGQRPADPGPLHARRELPPRPDRTTCARQIATLHGGPRLVQDIMPHLDQQRAINPALLIPMDASTVDPRLRLYPATFRNPLPELLARLDD